MKTQARLISFIGVATAACALAGCSSPALYVEKDTGVFPKKPITVHILGVDKEEKRILDQKGQAYWAYDYWKECRKSDFPVAPEARHPVQVSDQTVLTPKDPVWTTWRNHHATHLFIVADLPLNVTDGRWCVSIPFEPRQWKGKTATVIMGQKGLVNGTKSR